MWGAGNCEDESHNRPLKVTETTEQKKQKAMKQKAKGRNKNGIELRTQIQNHSSNHISRTEKQWLQFATIFGNIGEMIFCMGNLSRMILRNVQL